MSCRRRPRTGIRQVNGIATKGCPHVSSPYTHGPAHGYVPAVQARELLWYDDDVSAVILGGRYLLGRELGSGGYASVHEATDLASGRDVAVKVVLPAYRGQREVCERLEREGRIAASLAHPNVCAVSDVGHTDDGTAFIVLERLTGETLADRLARGRVSLDVALDVTTQLLRGLGAAHAAGIVHRDLKPANVFLGDAGHGPVLVKLLDFGLAQVPNAPAFEGAALTRTGIVVGTPAYMSPEQVRGARDLDARSDVYSVAVVVYETFAGERPFAELPQRDLLEAIAHRKPPSLATRAPSAPPSVVRAVDAALSVSRTHRPADALALLDRLLDGASSPANAPDARGVDDWDLPTWQGPPPSSRPR